MALKGNLRDFSLTSLLNLINLAKKTGTLVLEAPGETARISFREGKLAYSQIGQEDNSLAGILRSTNKISMSQYQVIKQRAANIPDKELGLRLINAGYVTQQDVLTSLQTYFTGVVRRLFAWVEGNFHFEPGEMPSEERILVRIDLENLIIEGTRQMREWEHLQEEIPSLDMALKFTERPGTNIKNINLSVEEWRVVHYVNPKNSVRQIAKATKMNELEIRRVVYSLLQAGLVELVRPGGAPVPQRPAQDAEQQKNLVTRIIGRILSI
jgi:hypothetical protein